MSASVRDLALFNLAIDSKLRASDLVRLKVEDVCSGPVVRDRAIITQLKTGRPVQFEITEITRQSVERLLVVQLLLGHAKIETTVRYLGVEVDDALRLAEQIEL